MDVMGQHHSSDLLHEIHGRVFEEDLQMVCMASGLSWLRLCMAAQFHQGRQQKQKK